MRIDGSAVRAGMVIEHQNKLWLVVKHEIRTPGNLRAFNQVEMKDVKTGIKTNIRLSSSESVERAQLDEKEYQFLFADGDNLTFMDNESYEQMTMPKEMVGDQLPFLQDGMNVTIQSHEGKPISIALPGTVVMQIVEADPVVKGQTASSSYKPAKLENGVRIMVPPHIESGTRVVVKVDAEGATYVERAKD